MESTDRTLNTVNRIICAEGIFKNFVTVLFGILDIKQKIFSFSSAGHNPLMIYHPGENKFEHLNAPGKPIGIMSSFMCKEKVIRVKSKDIIIGYTDGIIEAMDSRNKAFGLEQLEKVIRKNHHLIASKIQEKIIHSIKSFTGNTPQYDDMTLFIIKIKD